MKGAVGTNRVVDSVGELNEPAELVLPVEPVEPVEVVEFVGLVELEELAESVEVVELLEFHGAVVVDVVEGSTVKVSPDAMRVVVEL